MVQIVNTPGSLSAGHETRRPHIACSKGSSDIYIFGGDCQEYEDWQYNTVRKILHPRDWIRKSKRKTFMGSHKIKIVTASQL